MKPATRTIPGLIPVRVELKDGTGKWRGIRDLTDHAELCRAFGLDPIATTFDLPSSARGVGRMVSGAGGNDGRRRDVHGYVIRNGEVIGKLYVARESEKFKDVDPRDMYEFINRW